MEVTRTKRDVREAAGVQVTENLDEELIGQSRRHDEDCTQGWYNRVNCSRLDRRFQPDK